MCKCWLWFSEICLYNLSNFVWHGLNPTHASGFEAMKCGIGPKVTFHKGGKVERSDVTPSFLTIFHILFGLLCSCSIWTFISPFYHWTLFLFEFLFPFFLWTLVFNRGHILDFKKNLYYGHTYFGKIFGRFPDHMKWSHFIAFILLCVRL